MSRMGRGDLLARVAAALVALLALLLALALAACVAGTLWRWLRWAWCL